jgi:hypothetical protein
MTNEQILELVRFHFQEGGSREESVAYGKECGGDPWDYDIIEEYLSKSSLVYTPSHYTSLHSLTPQQTIPCNPGVTLIPGTPQINNSVKADV